MCYIIGFVIGVGTVWLALILKMSRGNIDESLGENPEDR